MQYFYSHFFLSLNPGGVAAPLPVCSFEDALSPAAAVAAAACCVHRADLMIFGKNITLKPLEDVAARSLLKNSRSALLFRSTPAASGVIPIPWRDKFARVVF
jgi:hypothetical protein